MAKKSTKNAGGTAVLEVETAGNTLMIPLDSITLNQEIAAREGEPDSEKVGWLAENFVERHQAGHNHQLQPAIVRSADGEKFELVDGRHRWEGCKAAAAADSDYNYPLWAIVVRVDDEQGLIDAIQTNEFRIEPNDFDRAASIEKLIALGKSQVECATIFGLSEASVSQIRKVGKLEKKYRKAIENGDLERDAAILIAALPVDDAARNEIFDEAMRHKQRFESMATSIENRKAKAEADTKIAEAKARAEEAKTLAKAKDAERKAKADEAKEIEKTAAKTKDVDALIEIRKQSGGIMEEAKKLEDEAKKLEKDAEKATKEVEKAKAAKEQLKEKLAAKPKVTQEDVKSVAKDKGVKGVSATPKTKKQFEVEIEAMASDQDDPMPEACGELIGVIEAYLDGDKSAKSLRNAFILYCKTDEQLEAARTKKKK